MKRMKQNQQWGRQTTQTAVSATCLKEIINTSYKINDQRNNHNQTSRKDRWEKRKYKLFTEHWLALK